VERRNVRKLFNIQQFLILFAKRDCVGVSPLRAHSTPIAKIGGPVCCSLPSVPCIRGSLLGRKKSRGCCKEWLKPVLLWLANSLRLA